MGMPGMRNHYNILLFEDAFHGLHSRVNSQLYNILIVAVCFVLTIYMYM